MTAEPLLVVARLAHTLAAATWVGGGIVYAVVGRPAPSAGARSFSWLAGLCGWVLLLSGGVLTFDRLSGTPLDGWYVALLALKLGVALAMFLVAGTLAPSAVVRLRQRRDGFVPRSAGDEEHRSWRPSALAAVWTAEGPPSARSDARPLARGLAAPYLVVYLGVAVYALGALLAVLYAQSLAAR
jgi:cytochrome b subunit of formate dehydrogenase